MAEIKWNSDHTITVDPPKRPKKITGTRLASILGLNKWSTPFATWCEITKTYQEPFEDTIYTIAGKTIEPKQAEYARKYATNLITPTDVYGKDYFNKTFGDFFPEDSSIMKNGVPIFTNGKLIYIKGGVANASRMMRSDRDGVIVSLEDLHEPDPDIVSVQFDYKVGDQVRKFRVSPDRLGHVITKGKSLDDAVGLLNRTLDKIHIEIE